jgi:mono/diheme cytochrome c family protein
MDGSMASGLNGRAWKLLCGSLAIALTGFGCQRSDPPAVPELSQPTAERVGLSAAERAEFYHLDEGSEVFPLAWFKALESETGQGLFTENLDRFGFLPDTSGPSNPHGLPVGITAADTRDLRDLGIKMIGINCAACHVGEIVVNGKAVRLDGAGGRADISKFFGGLAKATVATATSATKFLAFLKRLGPPTPSAFLSERDASRAASAFKALSDAGPGESGTAFDRQIEAELLKVLEEEVQRPAEPLPGTLILKPGADLDAATRAIRAQANRDLSRVATRQMPRTEPAAASIIAKEVGPSNVRPAVLALFGDVVTKVRLFKARVEFIVRLAQRLDVQATPPGYGRIDAFGGARNLLFEGHSRPTNAPVSYPHLWNFERVVWLHWDANTTSVLERNIGQALGLGAVLDRQTFASTVSVVNLHRLEQLAKKIKPPRWVDSIGPIDETAAAAGAALFQQHCASCHASDAAPDIDLKKIGTDPQRALNFAEPVGEVPNDRAIAELVGNIKRRAFDEKGFSDEQRRILDGNHQAAWRVMSSYAARPLIAPWASAPFLHNNSVPTLADLLLPPDQRPAKFFVGSAEYDVGRLGFVNSERPGSIAFDTTTPGNSNAGHNYGTNLSIAERRRLLEYLKKF